MNTPEAREVPIRRTGRHWKCFASQHVSVRKAPDLVAFRTTYVTADGEACIEWEAGAQWKPVSAPRRLFARPIERKPELSPSGWKATAACPVLPDYRSVLECGAWSAWRSNAPAKTRASLSAWGHPPATRQPLWKLETSEKVQTVPHARYAPPARMIKLTETRQITPCKWIRPTKERCRKRSGTLLTTGPVSSLG
ncbi:hypothetical protein M2175_004262 [Bradyrhizobium elkanii]|nr:hypothetical protein [Bradyrhizobium elkanii]MCS3969787.1 hypothetical protein [Bradyrhizobium japonicum]